MSEHDEHSSFIKTPQQLIVIVVLSFLVPVIGIVLLVKYVIGKPTADPGALAPEVVAKRIQPVGRIEFGAAGVGAAAGPRSGEQIVKTACAACHETGAANAPKIGDKAAWSGHIAEGLDAMMAVAIKGKGAMPPRGGGADLSDFELARAIVYMANKSGGNLKEPAAPASAEKPAAAAPAAATVVAAAPAAAPATPSAAPAAAAAAPAADGKKVYDTLCMACHATGVANAPRLGDKAAWAPRIQTGVDALIASVVKGKGAMPPKAGNAALSDADIRASVEYMVAQSK